MDIKLTNQNVFDLEINGKVFRNMKLTGKLDGIVQLANDEGQGATLVQTKSTFLQHFDEVLGGNPTTSWQLVRGSSAVVLAAKGADKPASIPHI